jgi:hypothetical protein
MLDTVWRWSLVDAQVDRAPLGVGEGHDRLGQVARLDQPLLELHALAFIALEVFENLLFCDYPVHFIILLARRSPSATSWRAGR